MVIEAKTRLHTAPSRRYRERVGVSEGAGGGVCIDLKARFHRIAVVGVFLSSTGRERLHLSAVALTWLASIGGGAALGLGRTGGCASLLRAPPARGRRRQVSRPLVYL